MKHDPATDQEFRKTIIGGSDLAPLFNISKYCDVHSLWMKKKGLLVEDISGKGVIKRGNKLEPIIADEFAEEKGLELIHSLETFRPQNKELALAHPWLGAHPDRLFESKQGKLWGLEIKTANRNVFFRNKNNGLDFGYLLQAVYYLYVTGAAGWVLRMKHPDSWDDYDWIIRRDPANDEIFKLILQRGDWFWNLLETNQQPPLEKAPKLPEVPAGEIKSVDTDQWSQVGQWLYEAQQEAKSANETLELAKEAVKLVMESNDWTAVNGPVMIGTEVQFLRSYHRKQAGKKTVQGKECLAVLGSLAALHADGKVDEIGKVLDAFVPNQFIKTGAISQPLRTFWIKQSQQQIEGDRK